MINPRPGGPPVYLQLAEILRTRIVTGKIAAGQALPSERTLQQEHALGRHTVRKAMAVLRAEGLVTFVRGTGMVARERAERQRLVPPAGAAVLTRMPSSEERDEFDLDDGVPVFAVRTPEGSEQVFPGDRWVLIWPG
jgi:DNA-binding FadR family transcriptional regulator